MTAQNRTPASALRAGLASLCLLALGGGARAQSGNVAINNTGAAAQPTALLDVSSITQGIFLPRMGTLPPAAALPNGLTVYKTLGINGFFVVEGGAWRPLLPGNNGWDIFGNYLSDTSNPNPDYLGTTDSAPMYFRTNNTHRMRLDGGTGYLGIGYGIAAGPSLERLDINGALRLYYASAPGVDASNTYAPGVFRYQPYGTVTGSGQYRYGSYEMPATYPNTSAVINAVLNTAHSYPLQYAAHWGNVNGSPRVQGTNTPVVIQPANNGWRAFENPYEEVRNKTWSHFREAECGPGTATFPNPPSLGLTTGYIPAAANPRFVSPFPCATTFITMRRQYLFRASELNLEQAQENGGPGTEGLCPGGAIDSIYFYVNPAALRALAATNFSLTVRHAPAGLNALTGFDNTSDYAGMSCGTDPALPNAYWPTGPTGSYKWFGIKLTPAFVWDGASNVLIEVATRTGPAATNPTPGYSHVACTDAGFSATYGADFTQTSLTSIALPAPVPPASCNDANNTTCMPDVAPTNPTYVSGSSQYRPVVRFAGTVAKAGPSGPGITGGQGNYIWYPGALILEDTSKTRNGVPFGRWTTGYPTGSTFTSYQGIGTITAQNGIYDNGLSLNDHVFDRAFDGRVAPGDAAQFGGQRLLDIGEMAAFTREHRHLPTIKGRAAWEASNGFSLGQLGNELWTTVETQALYVADLHDKLNVIEMLGNERPISAAEFRTAQTVLAGMAEYTDADKARLIADLRKRAPQPSPSR